MSQFTIDHIKIELWKFHQTFSFSFQIQTTGKAQYSGPMDVIKQTYRASGIRGIMRGTAITAVRGKNHNS